MIDTLDGSGRRVRGIGGDMRRMVAAVTVVVAASLVGGCGLLGQSWDVQMEVQGPGQATVGTKFAGEPDLERDPGAFAVATLPVEESRNVGFGFNDLEVRDAAPGTRCRILVDGEPVDEQLVDAGGTARCHANNQEDGA